MEGVYGNKTECARCPKVVCNGEQFDQGPPNCPTRIKSEVIKQAIAEYDRPEVREFARQASIQEFECYMSLPEGRTPRHPRVEEMAQFAKKWAIRSWELPFAVD